MRIAGIPLGVQPLWLVIVGLITWSLGHDYYPSEVHGISPVASYALGFGSALLLFASIVAHEYGHALTARRYGVQIEGIDLWLLGGVAKMRGQVHRPGDELRYALAGPAVTLVVAAVFGAITLLLPSSAPSALRAIVAYQVYVNTAILVFNLLPAFPLDGGRVTRALLWRRSGDLQSATAAAARVGRGFGWFFIAVGALNSFAGAVGGLWLVVIGLFVLLAASAEARHTELMEAFAGYRARDLMSAPPVSISADATLDQAVDLFQRFRFTSFPVTSMGEVVGLLTINHVLAVAPEDRLWTVVGDVADRDPSLVVDPSADLAELLEQAGFARDGRAVVVGDDGSAMGIVTVTDVERALRARRLTAPTSTGGRRE